MTPPAVAELGISLGGYKCFGQGKRTVFLTVKNFLNYALGKRCEPQSPGSVVTHCARPSISPDPVSEDVLWVCNNVTLFPSLLLKEDSHYLHNYKTLNICSMWQETLGIDFEAPLWSQCEQEVNFHKKKSRKCNIKEVMPVIHCNHIHKTFIINL